MSDWRPPTRWTDGPACPHDDTTMAELVLAQAARTPEKIAIHQWTERVTYRDLLGAAGLLARRLRAEGVGPEVRVGVCVRRDPRLVVAVLGVLLAGGAYVPLDPGHPVARLTSILDDAGIRVVVADEAGSVLLADTGRHLVEPPAPTDQPLPALPAIAPDNAAYVLYTSGSTGRPKGVVVSQRSMVAFGAAVARCRPTGPDTRSAAFASLSFDTSLFDLLHPLATGATVALLPGEDRVDPVRLQRFLVEHQVTRAMLPPAVVPLLEPERLPELTELFVAGEPCGPEQVARWATADRRFHNWYGPTETTVIVVGTELTGEWALPLPIGLPLPGCRAYVLDERMRPCPPGEPGELCIGGPQLARGYLGRPGHTADRFVPDPFGATPGGRLYRTGDRVTWRADGQVAFLGRLDRQVKINGQRVEIGELETVLSGHPAVRQAVVDVVEGSRLVAYLTPADGPDLDQVREYCERFLPGYMLPGKVVRRAELPLTVAGKVDMAALRSAEPAPVTAAPIDEPTVASVWAEVFGGPVPAMDTGFVAAGGDSLLAMRLVSALRARLGRQITVTDVHMGQTVAGLSELVRLADPIPDDTVPTGSPAALSALQRQLWFVEQLTPGVPAHNISMAERVTGPLDESALRRALRAVAVRQETLRWRVPAEHGAPTVVVDPPADVPLPVTDLSGLPDQDAEVRRLLDAEATTPFDLADGPLWRVRLIRLAEQRHVLAITVHHIVFDGWSADVLYRDIARAWRGAELAPLTSGFADYVAWRTNARDERPRAALDWWADHLADAPLVLDLPRDRDRPAVRTFRGARDGARIEPDVAARVRAVAKDNGTTPFVVLLTAFGQLLGRLTGQSELIVGTPLVDRGHQAFEPVVGCCLQMLPLRLTVAPDFETQVTACRDEVADALAHADAPMEQLVDALGGQRDLSRNPLVQVLFNMYNFAEARLDLPGATAEPLVPGLPGSLYDLTLYVSERDDSFELQAVYNPDLFDADRINALLASYVTLLDQCTSAPHQQASIRTARYSLPDPAAALSETDGPDLLARFAEVCERYADRVAVTGAGGELRYAELADLCRRTAASVAPDSVVAVLASRDVRLPATLLGVLAGGARWLVLDPAAPPAVLAAQLASVPVRDVLRLPGTEHVELPAPRPAGGLPGRGYLSLTSGTTGLPRPVITSDRPLAHFLAWYPEAFGLTGDDRFALLGGLAHDPVLRDALVPLMLGSTLCVPDAALPREPRQLLDWLAAQRISVLHLTPQLGRLLTRAGAELPAVRLIVTSGDQLTHADATALRGLAPNARLVNGYGTTETPQLHAIHKIGATGDDAHPVPVGHGIEGSQLLVLNQHGQPAGVGELGEVVIRSRYLADGYTDPVATQERFRGDTFRTGDLGRYLPDGAVVLAGRTDEQVKIRGFRVELGAVQAALASHPDIREACVLAVADGGERRLRGFAVPTRAGVRTWQLTDHLRGRLPDYAIPADITLLATFPLTRNGKLDRVALSRITPVGRPDSADELTGRTERVIAGVWSEVLGLPRPGAADNFFEVGGHSLAIVVVRDRLVGLLDRQIQVVDLFRHPTIRALAAYLDSTEGGHDSQMERAAQRAAWRRDRARRRITPKRGVGR